MIRHICFDYSTFKIIIKDRTGDNVIYCGCCITNHSCWLINCRYHAKFKHTINKILDTFRKVSVILKSPSGGLYTTLRLMFLEWLLIISIERDSILSQFVLRSSRILLRSESRINLAFHFPCDFS